MLNLILLTPAVALLLLATVRNKQWLHGIHCVGALGLMIFTGLGAIQTAQTGTLESNFPLALYCDSFAALMLGLVGVMGFLVALYTVEYLNREYGSEPAAGDSIRIFYLLLNGFILAMVLCLLSANLGIMWIAMEATTLSSVFLVGFHSSKRSMEAAWKYMTLCSVGIALALLAVVFLHLSSGTLAGLPDYKELNWHFLYQSATSLDPAVLKLAVIFSIVGFGTKAGLAPMHTWLPDAHSEAPSPVSALLSGVLLNTAVYCMVRFHAISSKALGPEYSGNLLVLFGMLSVGIAALSILTQRDYKRLLAYSSIEHMGLICVGMGLMTPASVVAVLFHTLNHGITKIMLFLASGRILQRYGTKEIHRVRGVIRALPVTGVAFLLGIFGITGFPPFGIFFSKLALLMAVFRGGHPWLGILMIALLALIFIGFAVSLFKMVWGEVPARGEGTEGEGPLTQGVLVVLLILAAVLGFHTPDGIKALIQNASVMIRGGA